MALAETGEAIDPDGLVALERPTPRIEEGRLVATVRYVDQFGNATLSADAEAASQAGLAQGTRVRVEAGADPADALYARTFADVAEGELVLYFNSSGGLALAVNRGSAAERLGLAAGDEVALSRVTSFGLPHLHLRVTDSTNDRARELAEAGAPSGTVVTAAEQSAGRGRHGRVWTRAGRSGAALLGDPAPARARAPAAAARGPPRRLRRDRVAGAGRLPDQVAERRLDRRAQGRRGADRGAAAGLGRDRGRRQRRDRRR